MIVNYIDLILILIILDKFSFYKYKKKFKDYGFPDTPLYSLDDPHPRNNLPPYKKSYSKKCL